MVMPRLILQTMIYLEHSLILILMVGMAMIVAQECWTDCLLLNLLEMNHNLKMKRKRRTRRTVVVLTLKWS